MIELRHGDCMDYMETLPDNAFELAIVDPPYGMDLANMNMGIGKNKKASKAHNRKWEAKDWDKNKPTKEYFEQLFRVSNNQIIWGGNHFELPTFYGYVIWDKGIPEGLSFADCELAWHSFKKAPRIFKWSAYRDKKIRTHPTQKPVKLYEWLLKNYAKEGDRILDTHLGSGSSAIAAHNMKYNFVGIELDHDYFTAASKRLHQHQQQIRMF